MRPGGGKRKGSAFERNVCRDLSLWVSLGQRDDVFWRSSMSGGRATIGLRTGNVRTAQAGDVSAIHALGERLLDHVVVECKSYADLNLFAGIANDTGRMHRFWVDLRLHAAKFGKRPMLVARQNGMPTVCLLEPEPADRLFGLGAECASAVLPRWGCYVVLFECFLREAAVPPAGAKVPAAPRRVLAGLSVSNEGPIPRNSG